MRKAYGWTAGLLIALSLALPAQPVRPSSASVQAEATLKKLLDSGKLRLSKRADLISRVEMVGDSLARVARRPIPWHFYVVDDKAANAFTPGEGVVVLTEGLLALDLDVDELAGVIAHEIAHGTERHLEIDEQRVAHQKSEQAAVKADYAELKSDYNSGKIAKEVYQSKVYFLQRRLQDLENEAHYIDGQKTHQREFNHEKEIEADMGGIRYAAAAGYDPEGLQRSLKKLLVHGVESFGKSYTGEGFTHPPTAKRLEVLQRVQADLHR